MKNKARLSNKIYRKIHHVFFTAVKDQDKVLFLYASYRHRKKIPKKDTDESNLYITQIPNEGAGIGHQIANYNGGYHYAQLLGIKHAYPGFRDEQWDKFLGFGENEITVDELKKQGYRIRTLPYFNESEESLSLIRQIIHSYAGNKIIFSVDLAQFYQKQYEVIPHIKEKFEHAKARACELELYDRSRINIAVHIRRGDIVQGQQSGEETLAKRWLTLEYYENILKQLSEKLPELPCIYLFSQGNEEEYKVLEQYGEVHYCLDMSAIESFLYMVRADILVISKSSFSYKPALLADGIRICPPGFWHGYPENEKWIVAGEDGSITLNQMYIKNRKQN